MPLILGTVHRIFVYGGILLFFTHCVLFQKKVEIRPIPFDYQAIGKNYFNPNNDRPFPLTIQRGNNLYNSVTADGKYLFYATDKDGNFDIWFRDLESSIVVPITEHPSQEYKPAISPDGKKLVFVSERYDPEGDLILLRIDPADWVESSLRGRRFINQKFQVLTNPQWKNQNFQERVTDTDPAWFPDSRRIVFSSDRFSPGVQNLILMDTNDGSMASLTFQGGSSPFVSSDGKTIYFLSYRDSELGEIYTYNMDSEKVERITNNSSLDFSPSISRDKKYLYYTSIPRDTNRNGILDERDKSYVVQKDLTTGREKFLTSGENSVFDTRYSDFNGGSVLFSASLYNAINIYFIPFTGSIPRQNSIIEQFNYALDYKKSGSLSQFFLALDSVELFFERDPLYPIYRSRVIATKVQYLRQVRRQAIAEEQYQLLLEDSGDNNQLSQAYSIVLNSKQSKDSISSIEMILNTVPKEDIDMRGSLLQLIAENQEKNKKFSALIATLERIQTECPTYHLIREVKGQYGHYEFTESSAVIPKFYVESIRQYESRMNEDSPISNIQKLEMKDILQDIHSKINRSKNPDETLMHIEKILSNSAFPKDSIILKNFMDFLKAESLRAKKSLTESNNILNRIIPIPENLDLYPMNQKAIFEIPLYTKMYRNPALLYSHFLKFKNSQDLGDNANALRDLQIFMEFYDPVLSPELDNKELTYLFLYWENKAIEFERLGNLREAAFHYYFNNLGMALAKSKNLSEEEFYSNYAVYYQRKMIDTIFAHGKSLRAKEEANLLERVNVLGEENLDVLGNLSKIVSYAQNLPLLDALKFLGDFRDLRTKDAIHEEALLLSNLYFSNHLERNRPFLNLAVSYGHAYYLINRSVINETSLYDRKSMTEAKKTQILENYKKAEYELRWILYTDPTFPDAYQLLGWLYQYIDIMKAKRIGSKEPTEEERYSSAYNRYFPEKNFEENVELYTQILEFLGDKYPNKKVLSDINLNLGNNYFLLNNYPRANDSASKVDEYSKFILSKSQFDDYRQEAVFRYNYGRSSLYRGNGKKAIEQFKIALQLYTEYEYKSIVGANDSDKSKEDLIDIKSKLALLNAMIGLSFMEMNEYENSISYIQQSISHNRVSNQIDSTNLWNALAIAYQKTGRFAESQNVLTISKDSYNKQVSSLSGWGISIQDGFWNLLLPDSIRVMGDGRFPGDLPLHFKGLLTDSISINNSIQKKDYHKALNEIEGRDRFIGDKKLRKWVMGNLVSQKSHALKGQIYYDSKDFENAYSHFHRMASDFGGFGNWEWEKIANTRRSYSAFGFVEERLQYSEEDEIIRILEFLEDNVKKLFELQKKYVSQCSVETDEVICKDRFKRDYFRYDLLLGLNHFYLGVTKEKLSKTGESRFHFMRALEYLTNPAYIDSNIHFLPSDPLPRRERIRNLLNLTRIHFRLGNEEEALRLQKKAKELAYEFRLERESFLADLTGFDIELSKPVDSTRVRNIFTLMNKSHQDSESIRMTLPEHIIKEYEYQTKIYLSLAKQQWLIPKAMDQFLQSRIARESFSSNLEYSDLELDAKVKAYNIVIKKILSEVRTLENRSISRENVKSNIQNLIQLRKERQKLEDEISSRFPRFTLFTLKDAYKKPNLINRSTYMRCYSMPGENVILVQSKSNQEILRLSPGEDWNVLRNRWASMDSIFFNPGDCNDLYARFLDSPIVSSGNIVFMDRDVDLSRSREGRDGRGRSILMTPIQSNNAKRIDNSIRTIVEDKMGYRLMDTEILFAPNESPSFPRQGLSYPGLGRLNIREIATQRSEINTIVLEGEFGFKKDLDSLQSLYYHVNAWRDINVVLSPPLNNEERMNFTRDSLQPGMKILGVLPTKLLLSDPKSRYRELKTAANFQERIKNYHSAYDIYFDAGSFLAPSDKEEYLENLLDIARTKKRLFNELEPDYFIIPILEEFKDDKDSINRIMTSFLVDCFSDRQLQKRRSVCESRYIDWIETNPPQKSAVQFHYNLYMGYTRELQNLNPKLEVLRDIDEFIKKSAISDLYTENFLFDDALDYAKEAMRLTISPREKEMIQNKMNEIQFHRAYLSGEEDFTYKRIDQEVTYALGYNREWDRYLSRVYSPNFKRLGESDQIFENYRRKMYQYWRDWNYGEEFESSSLVPDELYEGGSVLSRLTHLNRTLLFHLIKNSSKHQIQSESDRLMNQIIDQEWEEGFYNRAFSFMLYYSDELLRNGRINLAREYLKKFESSYKPNLEYHPMLENKYAYLMLKLSLFTTDIPFRKENQSLLSPDDREIYSYIQKMETEGIQSFASILNSYTQSRNRQGQPFTAYHRNKLLDLIQFMKQSSLSMNSTEGFLDAIHYEQMIHSYSERTLGLKPFFRDLPRFQSIHKELVQSLPSNQEISIVNDFQNTTYLIQVLDGKTKGRELFKDNRDIKTLIRRYYKVSSLGGDDSRNREIIDDRYKNFLRLNPNKIHYLYLTDYHFKSPILPRRDTLTLHIQNLESLIRKPKISLGTYKWQETGIQTRKESSFNLSWYNTLKSTENWEMKSISRPGGMNVNISQEEIRVDEKGHIVFGGTPVAQVPYKKSKRNGSYILSSNYLGDPQLLSNDLNSAYFHLDSIHSGIGYVSISDQSDFHNIYFIKRSLERKPFSMSGQDRFIESRNLVRELYPFDRYWMGYRIYTTSFVTP